MSIPSMSATPISQDSINAAV
ncbi:MAG: hypothetical protein RJA63_3255, partial [Pseudomonadota bacterium]